MSDWEEGGGRHTLRHLQCSTEIISPVREFWEGYLSLFLWSYLHNGKCLISRDEFTNLLLKLVTSVGCAVSDIRQ